MVNAQVVNRVPYHLFDDLNGWLSPSAAQIEISNSKDIRKGGGENEKQKFYGFH